MPKKKESISVEEHTQNIYKAKACKITSTRYRDIERSARKIYGNIARRSKRNPYIRSRYFKGEKIFLKLFWEHLHQKNQNERRRRLRFYACAIELLKVSTCEPEIVHSLGETLYRFAGMAPTDEVFYVQVKKDRKSNRYFMSVFPAKATKEVP